VVVDARAVGGWWHKLFHWHVRLARPAARRSAASLLEGRASQMLLAQVDGVIAFSQCRTSRSPADCVRQVWMALAWDL